MANNTGKTQEEQAAYNAASVLFHERFRGGRIAQMDAAQFADEFVIHFRGALKRLKDDENRVPIISPSDPVVEMVLNRALKDPAITEKPPRRRRE